MKVKNVKFPETERYEEGEIFILIGKKIKGKKKIKFNPSSRIKKCPLTWKATLINIVDLKNISRKDAIKIYTDHINYILNEY